MYIHVSWTWRFLGILGHLFQVGIAILAFYIGNEKQNKKRIYSLFVFLSLLAYSRISDFQHHWQDVFVGGIVGSLIAFFTFKFILNWHNYTTRFLSYTVGSQPLAIPSPYQGGNGNYIRMTRSRGFAPIR